MSLFRRLVNLARSDRHSSDLDRELEFHLAERTDALIAAGYSPAEARDEARRRFGNYGAQKERVRDADVPGGLDALMSDLRYAVRGLRKAPVLALVAILSLALGIGANTAIFSLIDAVVLRALPVSHPEALVRVGYGEGRSSSAEIFTNPIWEQVRDRQRVFDGAFAYGEEQFDLTTGGVARREFGAFVSGGFFSTLGLRPAVGRLLSAADDARGCQPLAVLSYAFWQSEYGGSADVIGRTISLERHPVPIVGVLAPGFDGIDVGRAASVYVPLCSKPILGDSPGSLDRRSQWWLQVIGRVKPNLSLEQVQAGLSSIAPATYAATLPPDWPPAARDRYLKRNLGATPAGSGVSELRMSYGRALVVLMTIVALVLLIACANVANLLLARGTVRAREMAVRVALGASRSRLTRQLLTESVLLALAGAAAGTLFTRWGTRLLVASMSTPNDPIVLDLSADTRVLVFTLAVALATGIAFGIAPAWRASRVPPNAALKAGGRGVLDGRNQFAASKALVVAQIAISLTLVVGAGLLLGTFRRLAAADLGFQPDDVLIVGVAPPAPEVEQPARQRAFQADLLRAMRAVPGVQSASLSQIVPVSGVEWNDAVAVEGYSPAAADDSIADFNAVSDQYFETLGTPVLAGRSFQDSDRLGTAPVAIVNEAFVRTFFRGTDVIGRTLRYGYDHLGQPVTIVGLVRDAKYKNVRTPAPPTVYLNVAQDSAPGRQINVELRVPAGSMKLAPAVVRTVAGVVPRSTVTLSSFSSRVAQTLKRERVLASVSGFFGLLALALAMLGLYGVMSYAVACRRTEIGIRMALGAGQRRVATMVVREVSAVLVLGLVAGLGLAALSTRLIASFLYGLTPMDVSTLIGSVVLLAIVALAAAYLPARRAALVDPMDALREE
jgi:predicted permease